MVTSRLIRYAANGTRVEIVLPGKVGLSAILIRTMTQRAKEKVAQGDLAICPLGFHFAFLRTTTFVCAQVL